MLFLREVCCSPTTAYGFSSRFRLRGKQAYHGYITTRAWSRPSSVARALHIQGRSVVRFGKGLRSASLTRVDVLENQTISYIFFVLAFVFYPFPSGKTIPSRITSVLSPYRVRSAKSLAQRVKRRTPMLKA